MRQMLLKALASGLIMSLFPFAAISAPAGPSHADSLLRLLAKTHDAVSRERIYVQLADLSGDSLNLAAPYWEAALAEAQKTGDIYGCKEALDFLVRKFAGRDARRAEKYIALADSILPGPRHALFRSSLYAYYIWKLMNDNTKNNTVVQSKAIDGTFPILPDDTVQVAFALNNVDEPIIQDYTVTIASEGWNEEDINPEAPMRIPDGYRYVSPEENLESICKSMLADASVNEVKLFLKAGATYKLGTQTEIPKALYIMGQAPGDGEELAFMEMGNMSINCPDAIIEAFHFENLKIKVTTSDFFKFKNQAFHVSTISWKNCEISDLVRTMWYQEVDAAQKQIADHIVIENCRFLGLNSGGSGLFGLSTKQDAPVHNFVFKNSTFHANNLTRALITGLGSMTGELNVTIENCTFVSMAPAAMTFFDLNPKNTSSFHLVVRNNLFSGVCEVGQGTWFTTRNVTSKTFENNYRTNGFVVANWGVDTAEIPVETALPMETLFKDVAGRDFTITDKNSEVYTNGIGDPHWIK